MIVVVAGMYRSGSTFSFNIVREILDARGGATSFSSDSLDSAFLGTVRTTHVVLKSHTPDNSCIERIRSGTALCICTYRKPEHAIASWSTAFGVDIDKSLDIVRQWLTRHRSIAMHAMNVNYENLDAAPLDVILDIQRYMLQVCDLQEAVRLRNKYDKEKIKNEYDCLQESERTTNIGFSYYDTTTFFHRRHVTSLGARAAHERMSDADIARIRYALRDFVDAHGDYKP